MSKNKRLISIDADVYEDLKEDKIVEKIILKQSPELKGIKLSMAYKIRRMRDYYLK